MRFRSSLGLGLVAFAGLAPVGDSQAPKVPEPPPIVVERGLGYVAPTPEKRAALYAAAEARHGNRLAMQARFQALPASFDCRERGWVPPVGDQGQCGSCYLYSTIYGTLSSAFIRAGYGKPDGSFIMSVQFGMDCHNFGGCNGGNGTEVIDWVMKNGWPAESWIDLGGNVFKDYPAYSARSLACRKVAGAKYWRPQDWGFATGDQSSRPATVDEIKTAMFNYGPLNVALDAGGQFGSGAGTITSLGGNINHEIEIVGWDDGDKTLLLKNQWSKQWGNGGYRKLAYAAANGLRDIFWVSAGSLPPPPSGVPVITSATSATGAVGVPFSYTVTASNNPQFFGAVGLPGGLALDYGGVISGVPRVAGKSEITLTARNASGTGTAILSLTIGGTPPVGVGTVQWTVNGQTSQYELMPLGTRKAIDDLRDALKRVQDLMAPDAALTGPCGCVP